MLINCTNHPYEIWNTAQREAAKKYGKVTDLPFPSVDPYADTEVLRKTAAEYVEKIEKMQPEAVLVAGEFTFTFMLVDKLLKDGITVLSTCSKRITKEEKKSDGTNEKMTVFVFECFRPYAYFD